MRGVEWILNLIFPQRCLLCDELLTVKENQVCTSCDIQRFMNEGNQCEQCGRPIANGEIRCNICKDTYFAYEKGFSLFKYEGILHTTFYRLKYGNRRDIGIALGKMMAKHYRDKIKELNIQIIIPVPLHKTRRKTRGYNQAEIIAKTVGCQLDLSVNANCLVRVKATKPQSSLNIKARQNNLKDAFRVISKCDYDNVLLVDDIYTTGNTMHQCAKVLKDAGVKKVFYLTAAIANQ